MHYLRPLKAPHSMLTQRALSSPGSQGCGQGAQAKARLRAACRPGRFYSCCRHAAEGAQAAAAPAVEAKKAKKSRRAEDPTLGQLEDVLHAVDDAQRPGGRDLADVAGVEPAVLLQHLVRLVLWAGRKGGGGWGMCACVRVVCMWVCVSACACTCECVLGGWGWGVGGRRGRARSALCCRTVQVRQVAAEKPMHVWLAGRQGQMDQHLSLVVAGKDSGAAHHHFAPAWSGATEVKRWRGPLQRWSVCCPADAQLGWRPSSSACCLAAALHSHRSDQFQPWT